MFLMRTIPRVVGLLAGVAFVALVSLIATAQEPPPRFTAIPLQPVQPAASGFTELAAPQVGILWTNRLSPERYTSRQNMMNGAGVALADFDGDGRVDIFACNKEGPSGLFKNLGNGTFTNVAASAGTTLTHLIATGAVAADVNGDGLPDLHVTSFLGPDALLINRGQGRFTNTTAQAGIANPGGNTSAAFSDIDGDGDLDLYLCRFGIEAILRDGARFTTRMVNGQPVVTGRFAKRLRIVNGQMTEVGEPDILFLNDGSGHFTPAPASRFTDEDGKPLQELPPDFGLAVQIRDFDGNGTPDIYVCNDFQTPDRFWLGDGRGNFRAAPRHTVRTMSYASMGVDAADIDRDGFLDFITTEMLARDHVRHLAQSSPMGPAPIPPGDLLSRSAVPRNALFWNRGNGSYAEIAWAAGVAMSDWSWAPVFLDVDLDGLEDLLISNGHAHDLNDLDAAARSSSDPARTPASAQKLILSYPPLRTPKAAWRNLGNLRFEPTADAWHFNTDLVVHGLALGDLDNDGDLDVVGNAWNHPPILWRNEASAPRVAVQLAGLAPNRQGIGAKVRLLHGAVPSQEQEMRAGGRYLSGDQAQLTFAAGHATSMAIEVTWRSGHVSRLRSVQPHHLYVIHEPEQTPNSTAPAPPLQTAARPAPRFVPVRLPPGFSHRESPDDDFTSQPLLPRRLSRPGPAATALLLPHETLLLLGGSEGGKIQCLQIATNGDTREIPGPSVDPLPGDVTSLIAIPRGNDTHEVFAGIARGSRSIGTPAALRFEHSKGSWKALPPIAATDASPGPIAIADLDGDSQPELLLAGRFLPGRYPLPAPIRILRREGDRWTDDPMLAKPLESLGLVTSLATADINGDRRPDLIAACEWGPLRIFSNTTGGLVDVTENLGLSRFTGLWQAIIATDLNGDGRPDLVAGNWGLNSYHQRAPAGPWSLYYGDAVGDGSIALLESFWNSALKTDVPFRHRAALATSFPAIPGAFPKHRDYAQAGVNALLGDAAGRFRKLSVNTLETTVFWNRGASMEPTPLPFPAQFTPVQGIAAADLNDDAATDLVLTQNLLAVRDEDDRLDAGLGLLLAADGKSGFRAVPVAESGIALVGEIRSVLTFDFDRDGKSDLFFTRNDAPPVLLRNAAATPAIR